MNETISTACKDQCLESIQTISGESRIYSLFSESENQMLLTFWTTKNTTESHVLVMFRIDER